MKILQYSFILLVTLTIIIHSCSKNNNETVIHSNSVSFDLRGGDSHAYTGGPINPEDTSWDCFELARSTCEFELMVTDTLDVPGYCPIKISYKLYRCGNSLNKVFVFDSVYWNIIVAECDSLYTNWDSLFEDSVNTLGDRILEFEFVLRRTLSDSVLIPFVNNNGYYCGLNYVASARFFNTQCTQWCLSGSGIYQTLSKVVCAFGCCVETTEYCLDNGQIKKTFSKQSSGPCVSGGSSCTGIPTSSCDNICDNEWGGGI